MVEFIVILSKVNIEQLLTFYIRLPNKTDLDCIYYIAAKIALHLVQCVVYQFLLWLYHVVSTFLLLENTSVLQTVLSLLFLTEEKKIGRKNKGIRYKNTSSQTLSDSRPRSYKDLATQLSTGWSILESLTYK